jgi:hypothetical protein
MKGFERWRAKAEAELERRFGLPGSTIREALWRKIFARNVTPRDGAAAAAIVAHHLRDAHRRETA